MADTYFLPDWPLLGNPMIWVGVLLIAGLLGGELAQRVLKLPRITGYAATGLLLGSGGLGFLGESVLKELTVFVDISIGLILFELGQRLDLHWLRRTPALVLMGVAEALCGALAVFFTLHYFFEYAALPAALAGAIAASTSPAVLMRVAADLRAQGQVTERALILVAINSVLAFLALTVIVPWVHLEYEGSAWLVLVHPLYLFGVSITIAWIASLITLRLVAMVGKNMERQFIVVIGMVLLTVGITLLLKASVLLALLAFGAMMRNFDREHHFMAVESGRAGQLFYVILFVVTGASLNVGVLVTAGWAAIAFVLVRFLGKAIGVLAMSPLVGLSLRNACLVSLSLAPMSGLAVVMVYQTSSLFPQLRGSVEPVVLAAVVILELFGPIATQFALRRAGEAAQEG
ncbi:MAG TPA: cation:proton antiporter [Burkholderiales bacterium]|jgi:Kef-type K+ transport system membrane component KefB|nr:cation:proton antiporter [Burkholderiales bacterium]